MTNIHVLPLSTLAGMALVMSAGLAVAASPKLIGSFGDWDSFQLSEGKAKTCYMRAAPASSAPAGAKRGEINLFVTHRTAGKAVNEVSAVAGYTYKPGSTVTITIGGAKFELFTDADGAWVEKAADEASLVAAMRAGAQLVLTGTSSRGTNTTDKYSLAGFSAAHAAISNACGVK